MRMNSLDELHDHLLSAKRIVALVGDGLGAASGLPTFKGTQGLWKNYNMIDLATPDAFYIDPGLVWQFYSWRRYKALQSQPNNGHKSLVRLSQVKDIDFITITQNVDGLSVRAGAPKDKLYEIQGLLFDLKCTNFLCNYQDHSNFQHPLCDGLKDCEQEYEPRKHKLDQSPETSPQFNPVKQLNEDELPKCPICNELLRPGVVWFGESLSIQLLDKIDSFIERGCDLILVVGTSGTVYPANSYVDRVKEKGGKVAVFNTDIDVGVLQGNENNVWGFKGDAAKLLPLALKPVIGDLS